MIEIIKARGKGYIAFFSPFGVLLGRNRYNKLLKALLRDFTMVFGEVFSGKDFHGVSKNKAISFTIWKFSRMIETPHEDLAFLHHGEQLNLKISPLLKDYWKYDTRKVIKGEIAAQVNYSFGSMIPKILHLNVAKGGSELIPENVKIWIKIENIPTELFYGLWSILVGRKSNIIDSPNYPVSFDNCYTHLPPLNTKTHEILAYAVLATLIFERDNNYCQGKIGFDGMKRRFKFGGKKLTTGAAHLLTKHGNCSVGNETIKGVYEKLKKDFQTDEKTRVHIREEVQKRLLEIGYWDYLPIPDIHAKKKR